MYDVSYVISHKYLISYQEDEGAWSENFKSHHDCKPRGNEAVSLDVAFPDANQVYGESRSMVQRISIIHVNNTLMFKTVLYVLLYIYIYKVVKNQVVCYAITQE